MTLWQYCHLTPFSSKAAIGLLMLLTNLLTCSKCLVISVASTMSMIACRSVRYSFLKRVRCMSVGGQVWDKDSNTKYRQGETLWQPALSPTWTVWPSVLLWQWPWMKALSTSPSEGTSTCGPFCFGTQITLPNCICQQIQGTGFIRTCAAEMIDLLWYVCIKVKSHYTMFSFKRRGA